MHCKTRENWPFSGLFLSRFSGYFNLWRLSPTKQKIKGGFVKGRFWRMCPRSGFWYQAREHPNVPSFRFLVPGNIRMYLRSVFRCRGTSAKTTLLETFANPQSSFDKKVGVLVPVCFGTRLGVSSAAPTGYQNGWVSKFATEPPFTGVSGPSGLEIAKKSQKRSSGGSAEKSQKIAGKV